MATLREQAECYRREGEIVTPEYVSREMYSGAKSGTRMFVTVYGARAMLFGKKPQVSRHRKCPWIPRSRGLTRAVTKPAGG